MAAKSFIDTLRDLRAGLCISDLDERLQQLVLAVGDTGKAGSLTLTIEVKPFERASGCLVVRDVVKAKVPVHDNKGTVLFATPEGNLSRNNPRQDDLPGLRLASEPADTKASA